MATGRTPCLVAVTGAGKTVMMAELARRALEAGSEVLAVHVVPPSVVISIVPVPVTRLT